MGGNSFSLGTSAPKQYITDKDTVIVVATYDRKDNGSLKDPVVSLGSLKDMNVAKDKNGNIIDDYNTVVYVANTSDSGRIADLVYIVKTEKAVYDNTVTFTNYAGGTYTLAVQSTNAQDNGDGTVGINDNQTLKFKITPKTVGTTTYELVSVKLGDEILTADTNDVYSVKVGTKDLTIDVTTKAQVVGKGDVSMDPAGNITVTWKNGDTNKPGPDEAVENVKTFLKAAGWKGDITVTKQGVEYVFTGKDSYGWDAQATWDTANNFYEARTFTLNGAEVTKNVAETLSAADANHYLIQKADAADDYALSSAATVGDLTDGAIVSTQGRKVTETNAAGTATDVYVDNDTYTVTEEGNWYKVGGGSEVSYATSKTITLSAKDTAVQTGLIKVDSNYKKIGEKVSVTTDGGSTYYQIDRNGTKTYDVYANEYTVTAGADVTITKGFIKVTVEKDSAAGNLINTIDGSATAEKFVSKNGGNVEVNIKTGDVTNGTYTLTGTGASSVNPSSITTTSIGVIDEDIELAIGASATDVTVQMKLVV